MKRLLAAAIAVSTLGTAPVAAEKAIGHNDMPHSQHTQKEGRIWLVLVLRSRIVTGGNSMLKIEMKDIDQCNEQGALYAANQSIQPDFQEGREFLCVEGK